MVDANVPDIALEPDKTVKKVRLYTSVISKKKTSEEICTKYLGNSF